jgi:hypothetical protein
MRELEIRRIPYFAIVGALLLLSLLMYTTGLSGFMEVLVPTYLTEALLFIAIGLSYMKGGYGEPGFNLFLMSGVWLLNQILHWGGVWSAGGNATAGSLMWILALVQLGLAYCVFTDTEILDVGGSGETWGHAAVWLVFLFGLSKLLLNLGLGAQPLAAMPLWGLGALILSLGYILEPVDDEISGYAALIGTLIMAYAALTVGGAGLSFFR